MSQVSGSDPKPVTGNLLTRVRLLLDLLAEDQMSPGKKDPQDPAERLFGHDPEDTMQRGMSSEAEDVDEAETMASTGDAEGSFREIVTGSATGLGIDRGESIGTGGLAAGEDLDEVAEGDYWRQNFERRPFEEPERSAERFEPGERLGWVSSAGLDPRDQGTRERGGTTPEDQLPHEDAEGPRHQDAAQRAVDRKPAKGRLRKKS